MDSLRDRDNLYHLSREVVRHYAHSRLYKRCLP